MAQDMADVAVELTGDMDVKEPLVNNKIFPSIPTSAPAAAEWLQNRRQNVRPWGTFLNSNKFNTPKSPAHLSTRVIRNIEFFQSNYIFIFLGLAIYCVLTSPLLLIALGTCLGACYMVYLKNAESRLRLFGRELNLAQQYAAIGLCSVPVFLLAGAGSAIFWLIGASFFCILLHASFFASEEELGDESFLTVQTI